MERLTNSGKEIPTLVDNAEYWLQVYFKLKDYEQAEEDGLLIRLPCKPGDKAYVIESHRIYEGIWYRVGMLEDLDGNGLEFEGYVYYDTFDDEERADIEVGICVDKNNERLGKTVFLTKSEAEQALAKMKGEEA